MTQNSMQDMSLELLDEQIIAARLAEIHAREEARNEIVNLVNSGKWGEALKKAQEANLSLTDEPAFWPGFTTYLDIQRSTVETNLANIQNKLALIQQILSQADRVIMEQEMKAACFRADEALQASDIKGLRQAVNDLERFQQDAVTLHTRALQTKLKAIISNSQPETPEWFLENLKGLLGTLPNNNLMTFQTQINNIDLDNRAMKALENLPSKVQDWVKTQQEEAKQVVPSWFTNRLVALTNDLDWIQGSSKNEELSSSSFLGANSVNWLKRFDNRPTGINSRIAVLRGQNLHNPDGNVSILVDLGNLEADWNGGKIESLEVRLGELEKKSRQNKDVLEQLAIKNHIAIFRQYISAYKLAKRSLSDARARLKEAKSYRGKATTAKALYAQAVFSEMNRLERDLLMLPSMVLKATLVEVQNVPSSQTNTNNPASPPVQLESNKLLILGQKIKQWFLGLREKKRNPAPDSTQVASMNVPLDGDGEYPTVPSVSGLGKSDSEGPILTVKDTYEQLVKDVDDFLRGK